MKVIIPSEEGSDLFDTYCDGHKVSAGRTESELRAFGWIGALKSGLDEFRGDFVNHLNRVDSATKATQSNPGSQLSRGRDVLRKFDEFYSALKEYQFGGLE